MININDRDGRIFLRDHKGTLCPLSKYLFFLFSKQSIHSRASLLHFPPFFRFLPLFCFLLPVQRAVLCNSIPKSLHSNHSIKLPVNFLIFFTNLLIHTIRIIPPKTSLFLLESANFSTSGNFIIVFCIKNFETNQNGRYSTIIFSPRFFQC